MSVLYGVGCSVVVGGGSSVGEEVVFGGGVPGSPGGGSGSFGVVRGCPPPCGAVRFLSLGVASFLLFALSPGSGVSAPLFVYLVYC